MRRWLPVAVVAALLATGAAVPAPAAPTVAVQVYVDGDTPTRSLTPAQLGAYDVNNAGYVVRGSPDQPGVTEPHSGWSIHDILGEAAVQAAAADVVGGDGQSFTLVGEDLDKPTTSFQDGRLPIVWTNGDVEESIIPVRSDHDTNREPASRPGGAIAIYAHTQGHIQVTGGPETNSASPGKPVRFQASTGDCPGGANPRVTWDFGDGGPPSAQPTHTYAAAGTYYGTVVADCGDGVGGAAGWQVGVGGPGAGPTPGAGATPTATASPTATPTPRPRRRATPTPTRRAGHGGRAGRGAPSSHATSPSSPAATPTATPAVSSTPPPTATQPSAGTRRHPRRTSPVRARSRLPLVSGRLISAVVPVSAAALAGSPARPTAAVAGGAPRPPARVAVPIGVLVLAALLLAGAWRERRRL
jgi:hypothetical protein